MSDYEHLAGVPRGGVAKILKYPDARLREISKPLAVDDAATLVQLGALVYTLRETIHNHGGYGLSAVQIGVPAQVFIVHVPSETSNPVVFVNASISSMSAELCELP